MIKLLYLILALLYPQVDSNVTRVIDGDTLDTDFGRVRILSINAPEKGQRCSNNATKFLESFNGSKLTFFRDIEDKDKYNRFLRHVYYQGELISQKMVRNGLAKSYCFFPNLNHCSEIKKAQTKAMENRIGCLWSESDETCLVISEADKRGDLAQITNICARNVGLDGVYAESDGRQRVKFFGTLCPRCVKDFSINIGDFLMVFDKMGLIDYRAF